MYITSIGLILNEFLQAMYLLIIICNDVFCYMIKIIVISTFSCLNFIKHLSFRFCNGYHIELNPERIADVVYERAWNKKECTNHLTNNTSECKNTTHHHMHIVKSSSHRTSSSSVLLDSIYSSYKLYFYDSILSSYRI
jgi:hypothetical protein